jgi:hypothetical protein
MGGRADREYKRGLARAGKLSRQGMVTSLPRLPGSHARECSSRKRSSSLPSRPTVSNQAGQMDSTLPSGFRRWVKPNDPDASSACEPSLGKLGSNAANDHNAAPGAFLRSSDAVTGCSPTPGRPGPELRAGSALSVETESRFNVSSEFGRYETNDNEVMACSSCDSVTG